MHGPAIRFVAVVAVWLLGPGAVAANQDDLSVFAPYSVQTKYSIDHQPWTDFLSRAVYFVGKSDRQPARRPSSQFRVSGTRLSTGSNSPYRLEGNRVLFHTFNSDVVEYIRLYRDALQDTVNRIEYAELSRDEQLAFWLNLYNAVVIHEIAVAHPVSKPHRLRAGESGESLFDAKLVEVHGVPLSLNEIRYDVVYRYWRNTDVIYGFWDGAIGSPNILLEAYEGQTVNAQLRANAKEFVNSLRGVDDSRGGLRFSRLYFEARPYYFPSWPDDLYAHLSRHAEYAVATALTKRPAEPRIGRYAEATADVGAGETVRPTGNDNAAAVAAGADLGAVWTNLTSDGMRGGLSSEAVILQRKVDERRSRRTGSVTILDIYTDDPDAGRGETLSVEPDDGQTGEQPEQ